MCQDPRGIRISQLQRRPSPVKKQDQLVDTAAFGNAGRGKCARQPGWPHYVPALMQLRQVRLKKAHPMKVLKPSFDNRRRAPNPEMSKPILQLSKTQTAAALMIGEYGENVDSELNKFRILNNCACVGCQRCRKSPPRRQTLSHGELLVLNIHETQLLDGRIGVVFRLSRQVV